MRLVDLSHLKWSQQLNNSGSTNGCYYKAIAKEKDGIYYYKCSCFYAYNDTFGDESVYEVICSRLFSLLGFDAVGYKLVYAIVKIENKLYKTYVCKSKDFFTGNYKSRTSLEKLVSYSGLSINNTIKKFNLYKGLKLILLADFLVIQRDRHGKNIEVLKDMKGNYVLAPLYDNGISFLAPYPSQSNSYDAKTFVALTDYRVNSYVGSDSLYKNLNLINLPIRVNKLKKEHRRTIFYGVGDSIPKDYKDKIWEIIVTRYIFLRKRGVIIDD